MSKWDNKRKIDKRCEYCKTEFKSRVNSAKFCSHSCSAQFSNNSRKPYSQEQKHKISESLKIFYKNHPEKRLRGEVASKNAAKATIGKYNQDPQNIFDMSHRTRSKIMDRLKLSCFRCGWNEAKCDIHHIHGRKCQEPHSHDKLTVLCPNCHRLAEEKKIDDKSLPTFKDKIGDKWRELYYG